MLGDEAGQGGGPAPERGAGRKVVDEGEAHLEIVRLLEQVKVI